jgi:single-stranded-DNA-specific exonuclease
MGLPAFRRDNIPIAQRSIRLKKQNLPEAEAIAGMFSLGTIPSRVLAARGFQANEELRTYLSPTLKDGLPDPSKLKNLEAAASLIAETIAAGKSIAICCDFDVDGLSGGAQVAHFLTTIGATCKTFVPDRFTEGYGLHEETVRSIAEQKFGLMVTIDFGTTNTKELSVAKQLGLPTVVIDHHHVGSHKPPATVFVNPNQSGCGFAKGVLSAAGLAWYLLLALRKAIPAAEGVDPRNYLDLACLGTICDMVPLLGANRVLARKGLEYLTATNRTGLKALKHVSGINGSVNCSDVSFGIGPRLNAAGRMVHGELVIDLLTTSNSEEAHKLARKLNSLNQERQDIEAAVKDLAVRQLQTLTEKPWGIVVWHKDFHTGVVGIVAQRLVESFYRPACVIGVDHEGALKGSVRGIKGFNVVEALTAVGAHLTKFGGHEGAGGFSLDASRIEDFTTAWNSECEKRLKKLELDPIAEADAEAALGEIDGTLVRELKQFAPFGMGNPSPQILVKDLKIAEVKILKNLHTKVVLTDGKYFLPAFLWRQTGHPAIKVGHQVNVVLRPEQSTFNGTTEIVGNVQAIEVAS